MEVPLTIHADKGLMELMAARKLSLAVTIVPDGLVLVGLSPQGNLSVEHRVIPHAWALAYEHGRLAVSNLREIIVYGNSPRLASSHPERPGHFDAFFTPQATFFTGDCSVHDMVITPRGLVVANTRFSSVCLIDGQYNFNPIWHPSFISAQMPEDRCHLNGLAVADNQVRYVTAFGAFDKKEGWRTRQGDQGVLVDVVQDSILLGNLSMPHSPRLFDGRLFVLESGFGAVLEIDPNTGKKRCLANFPGLTRGLCADQEVLFVGISQRRPSKNDWALPIDNPDVPTIAGVAAIDMNTGKVLGMMRIANSAREVFDVKLLPNITCPGIADTSKLDSFYIIDSPAGSYWLQTVPPPNRGEGVVDENKMIAT